jgi:hypothetical protein
MFLPTLNACNKFLGFKFAQVIYDQFLEDPRKKDKYFKSSEYPFTTFPHIIAFFLAQQPPSIKLNVEETSIKALSKQMTQSAQREKE